MSPVTNRWARLSARKRGWLSPASDAGVCISAFVVARQGTKIVLEKPKDNKAWPDEGGFPRRRIAKVVRDEAWILPATHLLIDKSPDQAAHRISHEWAGFKGTPRFVMVQSFTRPSRSKGRNHWDICFVYEIYVRSLPKSKPWWSEMRPFFRSELSRMKIGRSHLDVLKEARYV
ncbi:MAG: hypothetical protein ABSF09_09165 [Candidatus Bathyarchaeia archaeon]|jgi:ADP-ribose pyrophosphatase YjhB (NUDIX family)